MNYMLITFLLLTASCNLIPTCENGGVADCQPLPISNWMSFEFINNSGQVIDYSYSYVSVSIQKGVIITNALTGEPPRYSTDIKDYRSLSVDDLSFYQVEVVSFYVELYFEDGSQYVISGWNEVTSPMAGALQYGIGFIKDDTGIITNLDPNNQYKSIDYIITVNSPIDVQVSIAPTSMIM